MNWDDIIDKAETERFVGREQELFTFRLNLVRNPPRYVIFFLTGQGGAGKTTLLNRSREIAENEAFLVTDSDEQQRDIPEVLGRFAHQLAEQGFPLKRFDERYKTYRQKMEEIENDPSAPQGLADLLGKTLVRGAYIAGDLVPGLRKGLEYIPQEAVETQASEWSMYLLKKITNKDEVILLKEPITVLTPLFFQDLNDVAGKHPVLLCFDNFEATRNNLQPWLLRLREYKLSANIRIAIAGRDVPGPDWDRLRSVTLQIPLDIFTELEAEQFLDAYGIDDVRRRVEILEFSGRLPVLMSWLVAAGGVEPDVSVPASDIVERFLRWVSEPDLRRAALLLSTPRTFNLDVVKLVLTANAITVDAQLVFEWLRKMPFVKARTSGWEYHPVVRRTMLIYQRQESPENYRQTHAYLSSFYQLKDTKYQWSDEQWRRQALSHIYHLLATDPVKNWNETIDLFALAVARSRTFAMELIELLDSDIVRDELRDKQIKLMRLFHQQMQRIKGGTIEDGFEMFDKLCSMSGLSARARAFSLWYRGQCHRTKGSFKEAILDLHSALDLVPNDTTIIGEIGETYRQMKNYSDALVTFNRALELDSEFHWVHEQKGLTLQAMRRYEEAIDALTDAERTWKRCTVCIVIRGQVYESMKKYEEALADFNRALELKPQNAWALVNRAELYKLTKKYALALDDLSRVIEMEPHKAGAFLVRGEVYLQMKQYDEALRDIEHAVRISPDLEHRGYKAIGVVLRNVGRINEALNAFVKSLTSHPECIDCWIQLVETYEHVNARSEIPSLINQIQIPLAETADSYYCLAEALRRRKYYSEAIVYFDRAIELGSKDVKLFVGRGRANIATGRYEKAIMDFDLALEQKGGVDSSLLSTRGEIRRRLGMYQEAIMDFDLALTLADDSQTLVQRGQAKRKLLRLEEAVMDFDRAIALVGSVDAWLFVYRGQVKDAMGCYEEAAKDYAQAIVLDRTIRSKISDDIGLNLSHRGLFSEAIEAYMLNITGRASDIFILYNIATAKVRWKGLTEAYSEIDAARNALQRDQKQGVTVYIVYGQAGLEALLGNYKQALEYLEQAILLSDEAKIWARHDVAWLDLRSDERYQALIL